jgi:hypothetical protein
MSALFAFLNVAGYAQHLQVSYRAEQVSYKLIPTD